MGIEHTTLKVPGIHRQFPRSGCLRPEKSEGEAQGPNQSQEPVFGGLPAAGVGAVPVRSAVTAAAAAVPYPFKLGVASGEPDANSVVLWTRLAPTPLNADGQGGMANADVAVDWQVSTTDTFTTLVASGRFTAQYAARPLGARRRGRARPDAEYYYRFRAQGQISPVGRTRTAPAAGTVGRDLMMAFASCAHYE